MIIVKHKQKNPVTKYMKYKRAKTLNYLHVPCFAEGVDDTFFNWTPAIEITSAHSSAV